MIVEIEFFDYLLINLNTSEIIYKVLLKKVR